MLRRLVASDLAVDECVSVVGLCCDRERVTLYGAKTVTRVYVMCVNVWSINWTYTVHSWQFCFSYIYPRHHNAVMVSWIVNNQIIANFSTEYASEEFLTSVNIWRRYGQTFSGTFLYGSRYVCAVLCGDMDNAVRNILCRHQSHVSLCRRLMHDPTLYITTCAGIWHEFWGVGSFPPPFHFLPTLPAPPFGPSPAAERFSGLSRPVSEHSGLLI